MWAAVVANALSIVWSAALLRERAANLRDSTDTMMNTPPAASQIPVHLPVLSHASWGRSRLHSTRRLPATVEPPTAMQQPRLQHSSDYRTCPLPPSPTRTPHHA